MTYGKERHMARKLTLSPYDFAEGLLNTYENAARISGYPVTERTTYDCQKLDVASNIQDAWIAYYRDGTLEKSPDLSECDVNQQVMALLLNYGAKVSPNLSDNEIQIHPGFASEAASLP